MDLENLLHALSALDASDLHLKVGSPPFARVHGELVPVADAGPMSEDDLRQAFEAVTEPSQRTVFETQWELDFSYQLADEVRFRVNAARERGRLGLSFRRIPIVIPPLESLGVPPLCETLALRRRGLILVTGPTGSGKSTTLAAMIDHLNHREARRVVTIEDPIEYLYRDDRCVITQRELGGDTHSFAAATRQALRQDPDVLLVGEMRDPETIAACLTAAETGHLVLSTLHTNNGPQTIDRIVDVFPPHQQGQVRMQLSLTLEAVLAQLLLPRADGRGRVPAVEVMLASPAIRNLIREGKTHQMGSVIQTGSQAGMQTIDQSLRDLLRTGRIRAETAMEYASSPDALRS
ncbi:MAG TPA: type IV pilus twitching motility protein PilT [Anaerolineales bacterium]|nr:type IV pilus twitching motility protein PilT [Anaerolineales bacterium]